MKFLTVWSFLLLGMFSSCSLCAVTMDYCPSIVVKMPSDQIHFYSLDKRFEIFQRTVWQEGKKIFIETGTAGGEGIYRASVAGFEEIFTVECCSEIHKYAEAIFGGHPKIHLYLGDSAQVLQEILPSIQEPVVFWLDAHYDGPLGEDFLGDSNDKCPLLRELRVIASHHIKTHTILIDDVRCFGTECFDFLSLQEVIDVIRQINPAYEITFEDGYVSNDVLVAKIKINEDV